MTTARPPDSTISGSASDRISATRMPTESQRWLRVSKRSMNAGSATNPWIEAIPWKLPSTWSEMSASASWLARCKSNSRRMPSWTQASPNPTGTSTSSVSNGDSVNIFHMVSTVATTTLASARPPKPTIARTQVMSLEARDTMSPVLRVA